MGILARISFRNLTRQKRRNALLGLGIGFGMMILVIANSFSNGLVDVLINDIVANVAGHVSISGSDNRKEILRDRERIDNAIQGFDDIILYKSEAIGIFTQVIGNGKTDNMVIVGIENEEEFWTEFMSVVEGSIEDFDTERYLYPVVMSPQKAKELNLQVGDQLRTRLTMVTDQVQSATMQLIALGETNNAFMEVVIFMELNKLRELMGYRDFEVGAYQFTIVDPKKNSKSMADKIHERLKPELLSVVGQANGEAIRLFAYENDKETYELLFNELDIVDGIKSNYLSKAGVLISRNLSEKIGVGVGERFLYEYESRYRGLYQEELKVQAIFNSKDKFEDDIVIVNAERIYKNYNIFLPKYTVDGHFNSTDSFYKALAREYYLYDRVDDATAYRQQRRIERRRRSDRAKIGVVTMYEVASEILMMETILNGITWLVVLVLFFIILIGVVNTLRMTIKERTREIGTLRAIGMQAKDVKNSFILESIYLSFISCVIGSFFGFIICSILGRIKLDTGGALSIILKESRINFIFDFKQIAFNILLIILITAITAYLPARKASKISAANALRHYE